MSDPLKAPGFTIARLDLDHWKDHHSNCGRGGHGCAVCEAVGEIRWSRGVLLRIREVIEGAVEKLRGVEGWEAREVREALRKVIGEE